MSKRPTVKSLRVGGIAAAFILGCGVLLAVPALSSSAPPGVPDAGSSAKTDQQSRNALYEQGKRIFRFDTFGDEAFWSGQLRLQQAIEGVRNGGVGAGVSPKTALGVGLKVDAEALPPAVVQAIKQGKVDLDDPATTLTLLKLNAVVGVQAKFSNDGRQLKSIGITCALCHSTVDDSFAAGIGKRLDGWPNQDLNVGLIVSLAPSLKPFADELGVDEDTVRKVLTSWGPGMYDAELNLDGKAFRPDGKSAATRIPAAYGHLGEDLHTWTAGFGDVTYWNAYVANLEMHGQGNFNDARFEDKAHFPIAARTGQAHVRHQPDLITPKLAALQFYQLSLPAPTPSASSYDHAAAARGARLFNGVARCAGCHMPPLYTDAGYNVHKPAEICIDSFQAERGPDRAYVTPQLAGLWARSKRGFYHDGRYPTLLAVIEHYNRCDKLGLNPGQQQDLVQYLKSL